MGAGAGQSRSGRPRCKKGRRTVAIQVKSTRKGCIDYCAQISQRQETSLIRSSAARRASAVVALVSRNTVTFVSGRQILGEGRRLNTDATII